MRGLAAVLLAVLALPAQAGHLGPYYYMPTEHDDQGSVVEPDFARTSVLGPMVTNKVVDADLDGYAVADDALPRPFPGLGQVIAPGCTDDAGRRPNGLCGLWTSGAGTPTGAAVRLLPSGMAGVRGMGGDAAPGAFTPTKADRVRFLDARVTLSGAPYGPYLDVNRKLDEGARLATLGGHRDVAVGPSAFWAWYGLWQDRNGNGVVDVHEGNPPGPANTEFVWFGNCTPDAPHTEIWWCRDDVEKVAGGRTRMWGYLFPGNHHGGCGGHYEPTFGCGPHPADLPGRQVIHVLGQRGVPVCVPGTIPGMFCPGPGEDLDEAGERWWGDPLLDDQGSVAPDQEYEDRTSDPFVTSRVWRYGIGFPVWMYDQSLLVTLVHTTVVGCAASGGANRLDLPTCRFADVDVYEAVHPGLEQLLAAQVKPVARATWLSVRDGGLPL